MRYNKPVTHGDYTKLTIYEKVTKLFNERLQAWKHACGYIEDYIQTTEKMQAAHHKEYEKVVKTVSQPLKEGDHFDTNLGGVNEMFDNIRSGTQVRLHTPCKIRVTDAEDLY